MSKNTTYSTLKKYKLVFIGDQSVGKTSLLNRFMYDTFDGQYQATIGIDFLSKTVYLDDRTVRLQLWDTAGQERFRSLIPSYIRDSSVALVVFDITTKSSFDNIDQWIEDVRCARDQEALIYLVGNKCDLVDKRLMRQVTFEEAQKKAQEIGIQYMETSAKSGSNVKNLFQTISRSLLECEHDDLKQRTEVIDLKQYTPTPTSNCSC